MFVIFSIEFNFSVILLVEVVLSGVMGRAMKNYIKILYKLGIQICYEYLYVIG